MWRVESLRGREVYLDSNIFIYAFESADHPALGGIRALLRDISNGTTHARTSLLTRAEVLVRPLREQQQDLAEFYRNLLSGTQPISVQPLDGAIVDRAAALRAVHGRLRLADALHLSTSLLCECDGLLTADKQLAAIDADIKVLPLHDMAPEPPEHRTP